MATKRRSGLDAILAEHPIREARRLPKGQTLTREEHQLAYNRAVAALKRKHEADYWRLVDEARENVRRQRQAS